MLANTEWVVGGLIGAVAGAAGLIVYFRVRGQRGLDQARAESQRLLEDARAEAEQTRKAAEVEAQGEYLKRREQFEAESNETRRELKETEKRLAKREDNFERKMDTLSMKERKIEQLEASVAAKEASMKEREAELERLADDARRKLHQISGIGPEEAKQLLFRQLEHDLSLEQATIVRNAIEQAKEEAKEKSRDVILTAIQRYAAEHTSEATVATVAIPSDDMKGRVIGREGRNIRAFEKVTGVDVIVDDTPGIVEVSAFDPVRLYKARVTLERLIQDGRIQPGRIEEIFSQVSKEVDREIVETGKQAAMETKITGLHPRQIELIGRLKFRTSYGQNVLRHSVEVAYLCQVIADELGLDGKLARRCGLLHDIGKAVDHDELEGGHPKIGADICRKLNERPEVLNAIEGHHGDIESISPYTPIVMAADAISAARPGSRRESLERYIQRLQQFEAIATAHDGVKEAFAIQAGREIRVIVDAKKVSDDDAARISRDIARRIEAEMTYPGEIRVTVLRELRAIEIAR
ncbi:MAG: Ribonuclease Y [Phycisphaerae bacterium]|nr:Ribonuclease Y [Phycisphaerae bacterium]